ncbi:hypothetical protein PFICI_06123 [Pestalotiopsis fici W106-1]|uniref:DUF6536 domain-containing protein n=1 Tax=Pestalotiopsis fici (strain W106-1 / CGMCC3.15140) TaxID=1229662 RepID=W3X7H4_PESFW|nr:uncharacterized protein PFICI_06123 [Pestalotiopsis fici W106-1]ETS81121.1 hypothetical protein PFICI_06123 [Pestalotiopsis fici W106-1]
MPQWEPVPLTDIPGGGSQWIEEPGTGRVARGSNRSWLQKLAIFSKHRAKTSKDRFIDYWKGWRTGIAFCITVSSAVLALNLVLATIAQLNKTRNLAGIVVEDGLSTFHEGSCQTTKTISLVTHLIINILSTLLLGCSNYCMQILASPTRDEIDAAHSKRQWLRIGVPNFQNLAHVDWRRSVLCVLLAVTSLPLHLLWNSAIVQTVSSNDFYVGGVTSNFDSGINATVDGPLFIEGWYTGDHQNFSDVWLKAMSGPNVTRLTASDCITEYGTPMLQKYSNVALVFNLENKTNTLLFAGIHTTGADEHGDNGTIGVGDTWVCGFPSPFSTVCEISSLAENNGSYWTPLSAASGWRTLESNQYLADIASSNTSVTGCLAETVDRPCRIGTTPAILYVVAAANAIKVFCFLCTWVLTSHQPRRAGEERIVTNGDLIASYLRQPDTRFAGRCLASARLVRKGGRQQGHDMTEAGFWDFGTEMPLQWLGGQSQRQNKTVGESSPSRLPSLPFFRRKQSHRGKRAVEKAPRWHTGPSGVTWLTYMLPSGLSIIALIALFFAFGLDGYLFLDFGQASTQATISVGKGSGPGESLGVVRSTLIANVPQVAVTYVYVACNSVLTSMLAHHEISSYAVRDRGLRVSFPRRHTAQRGTYFLQLPWKFAIPLMTISTVLHWCLSQSLFVLRVSVYKPDGLEDLDNLISTVGYSSGPILASLGILALFLLGVCALGWFKRYEGANYMPLVANCSASLAAATCPPLRQAGSPDIETSHERQAGKSNDPGLYSNMRYNVETAYDSQFSIGHDSNSRAERCLAEEKLFWGEFSVHDGKATDDEVSHAGFSAGEVGRIQIGHLYA